MFEIGFSELVMIGLVSLIVIGPERLPKVARMVGFWIGKSRAMMANVKAEIQYELHEEELRQLLNEQVNLTELNSTLTETLESTQALSNSLVESLEDTQKDLKQLDEHQ